MLIFATDRFGKKSILALFMALFCIVVWGASYAVTRSAVQQIGPLTLACLRFYLAAGLLWCLIRPRSIQLQWIHRREIVNLTMSGIILYFAFENIGLKLTTASHGALIIATIPLGTELVWAWYHRCWPLWYTWLGTVAAISGVFLLVGWGESGASLVGDLLMFGAVGCWIVYTFQIERISGRYPPLVLTFWMMLIGAAAFTPGAMVELWIYPIPQPDLLTCGQVLFLAFACSAVGYDFWNRAVPVLGPTIINTLLYLIPLVGVTSGIVFLKEPVTPSLFTGGGLIILGVFIVRKR